MPASQHVPVPHQRAAPEAPPGNAADGAAQPAGDRGRPGGHLHRARTPRRGRAPGSGSVPPATSPRPSGCSPTTSTASCWTSRCPARDPDDELAALRHVLRLAPRHAVLALTAVHARGARRRRRSGSARRTTSSATSWTAGCSAAPSGTRWSASARTRPSTSWPSPGCARRRTPAWSAGCCPPRCSTARTCGSPPATGPAAPGRCSAATSTTRCARPTAPSTR